MLLLYLGNAHQSSCPHDTAVGTEGTENEQAMPDVHGCSVQASGTYPVAVNGVHPHGLINATEPAGDTAAISNSGATTSPRNCTVGCKSFGRYVLLGFKQQQQDLIYNHLCLRK